jgi:hypothetical protein
LGRVHPPLFRRPEVREEVMWRSGNKNVRVCRTEPRYSIARLA